jgi:hypothetical protein
VPENEPFQNAPHLKPLMAVPVGPRADGAEHDGWGGAVVPAHVRTMHRIWAGEYVRLEAEDGAGAGLGLLHRLRYQEPDADPWRLLEQVTKQALALGGPCAGNDAGSTDTPPAAEGTDA